MKWHWIQVNGDTSKYSTLIEKKTLKEWGSLGNEGRKRRRGGKDKEYYAKWSKPISKKHG